MFRSLTGHLYLIIFLAYCISGLKSASARLLKLLDMSCLFWSVFDGLVHSRYKDPTSDCDAPGPLLGPRTAGGWRLSAEMMPEDNNNCEPETSGGERTTDGRFDVGPAECGDRASPRRARKKVSVVTFVEGERKTSIYNWVGHTSSHLITLSIYPEKG